MKENQIILYLVSGDHSCPLRSAVTMQFTFKPFSRIVIARRGDGVTVKFRSAIPGDLTLVERTLSFTDGNELTLFDSLKVKSTWPLKHPDEVRDFINNLAPHAD